MTGLDIGYIVAAVAYVALTAAFLRLMLRRKPDNSGSAEDGGNNSDEKESISSQSAKEEKEEDSGLDRELRKLLAESRQEFGLGDLSDEETLRWLNTHYTAEAEKFEAKAAKYREIAAWMEQMLSRHFSDAGSEAWIDRYVSEQGITGEQEKIWREKLRKKFNSG